MLKKVVTIFFVIMTLLISSLTYAASILTIEPTSSTPIAVTSTTNSSTVTFTVRNTSTKPIKNITVDAGYNISPHLLRVELINNSCGELQNNGLCTFVVSLQGMGGTGQALLMPRVCGFSGAICSVPELNDRIPINITISQNQNTVGGLISGLSGTVVLQNNGTDVQTISGDGGFTFPTPITEGNTYNVTIKTQPIDQMCTVNNGSGVMGSAKVTNVTVTCSTNAYTVGGNVSGLTGTVVLQNNGGDNQSISSNGDFTFTTSIAQGSNYVVTVFTTTFRANMHCCQRLRHGG